MKTREIAALLGSELEGDGDVSITRAASIDSAVTGDIAFIDKADFRLETDASCLIVPLDLDLDISTPIIRARTPKLAFALVAEKLHPAEVRTDRDINTSIAQTAVVNASHIGAFVSVGESSFVADGCQLHSGARIGRNVKIGDNTVVHANCVIYDNVEIGRNCVIHAGTVIGADGFGFVRGDDRYVKFPQIGTVVIEDNVEIGANSCIDRGALGETRIGDGTKIDNLVQVAHNVSIGKRVVIAAQTGISGSTVIEDDCVIGGQVGMGDHARVQSGAVIGSQAGVLPGKIVRPGVWWGTPVQPLEEYKRQNAQLKGIGRLKDQIRSINAKIAEIESASDRSNETE